MRISFDLDGVLFAGPGDEADAPIFNYVSGPGSVYPLRQGARNLLGSLGERGWHVAVYTGSLRSVKSIWAWGFRMGMPFDLIINQSLHEQRCEELGIAPCLAPAKAPGWFDIDLHVDDRPEIVEAIRDMGGAAVLILGGDAKWTDSVLGAAAALENRIASKPGGLS